MNSELQCVISGLTMSYEEWIVEYWGRAGGMYEAQPDVSKDIKLGNLVWVN